MPPPVFISYSRGESPFVNVLVDALDDSDVEVWADYRSLLPARPWLEQILVAIDAAEVFLLVVSKEALTSRKVDLEYKHALELNKRIILLILEAVSLPAEMQAHEWIDFRGSFWWQRRKLLRQMQIPPVEQPAAPQKGFRASFVVWLSFWISWLAIAISIPAWWTIYIPILLIPLPFGILRRDYDFYRVRFVSFTLPIVLLLSWVLSLNYPGIQPLATFCLLASILAAPLLLLLLGSKEMRLWGKPLASAPRFANPYRSRVKQPEPVPFYIEYAPEDRKYAEALASGLRKHGHPQVMSAGEAQADFVIISGYKNSTLINPEKRVVYPVIIQDVQVTDPVLRRIQWIDFRRGIRHLDSLAKLLPEPAQLLNEMSATPIGERTHYPRIIQILEFFLILLGFFSISAWLPVVMESALQFMLLPKDHPYVAVNALFSALIMLVVLISRRALITRSGRLASLGSLIGVVVWVGLFGFAQCAYNLIHLADIFTVADPIAALAQDLRRSLVLFFPIAYLLGLILIGFFAFWNWGDLARWFPHRDPKSR